MRGHLFILLFLFNLWGLRTVHRLYETRNQYSSHLNNTACTEEKLGWCAEAAPVQFSRFVWLITDGMPVSRSGAVLENLAPHSVSYEVHVGGLKYSHAIYTSHLNGQPPTNYKGLPITQDHLTLSLKRAGFPLRYYGPEWSWLAINGRQHYEELFANVTLFEESKQETFYHSYPFFFETKSAKSRLSALLEEFSSSGDSIIAHSGVWDHLQHGSKNAGGFVHVSDAVLDLSAQLYAEDMLMVQQWVDKNPDVLLIVSSDHGIDEVVGGSRQTHGGSHPGNQGYFVFYHASLEPREMETIEVVDVCATLASFLRGVSIPYDNNGVTRAHFGASPAAKRARLAMLRLNIRQLNQTALTRGIDLGIAEPDASASEQELVQMAEEFSSHLVLPLTRPVSLWILYLCAFVLINVYLVVRFQHGLIALIQRRDVFSAFSGVGFTFISVAFFSSQLLSRYPHYGAVFKDGSFFWIWSPALGLLLLYSLASLPEAMHSKASYKMAVYFVFLSELSNWGISSVTRVFARIIVGHLDEFSALYSSVLLVAVLGMLAAEVSESNGSLSRAFSGLAALAYVCCVVYEWSERAFYLYVGGVHVAALYVAAFATLGTVYGALLGRTRHIVVALTVLSWLLCTGRPFMRIVLLIALFQYRFVLAPLLVGTFDTLCQLHAMLHTLDEGSFVLAKLRALHLSGIVAAAAVCYYLLQPFYLFVALQSDRFNLDFDPNVGSVGLLAWDKWPVTSSLMMMWAKYMLLVLFAFCAWALMRTLQQDVSRKQGPIRKSSNRRDSRKQVPDAHLLLKPMELFTIFLAMLIFSAHLGYYQSVVYFSRFLPINEYFAYVTAVSTMVGIFSILGVIDYARQLLGFTAADASAPRGKSPALTV